MVYMVVAAYHLVPKHLLCNKTLVAGQICRLLCASVQAEYTSRVDDHDDRDVCTH